MVFPGVGSNSPPARAVVTLTAARARGAPIEQLLYARAATLRLETKRRSLPQVASALRLWHCFAQGVLGYASVETFRPRSASDVEAFIAVFRVAATAQNYAGSLRWACKHLHLSRHWDTDEVALTLRGANRRQIRLTGGARHTEGLIATILLAKVVEIADRAGHEGLADICVMCWEF